MIKILNWLRQITQESSACNKNALRSIDTTNDSIIIYLIGKSITFKVVEIASTLRVAPRPRTHY